MKTKKIGQINIIGNNGDNCPISDGGRIKIRLYKTLLEKEGFQVNIIELNGWKKHFINIMREILRALHKKENIVIMAGPKGCRLIIPFVYHFNKKGSSHVVFCPLGIGTLDALIRTMTEKEAQLFLNSKIAIKRTDKKMAKMLSSFAYVAVENVVLLNKYKSFYHIMNVVLLENFRDVTISRKTYSLSDNLRVIYLSRVKANKGVFDIIEAVLMVNRKEKNRKVLLDIYGDNQLADEERTLFLSKINGFIQYKGVIKPSDSISTIKQYDLFCLPTKYYGEGTPGSLIESMIAGTPALLSSYSQAEAFIHDGVNGFLFDFDSTDSLISKLSYILHNKTILKKIGVNAQMKAKQFVYANNKDLFLKVLVGNNN